MSGLETLLAERNLDHDVLMELGKGTPIGKQADDKLKTL